MYFDLNIQSFLPLNYCYWTILPHNTVFKNENQVFNFQVQNQKIVKQEFFIPESSITQKQVKNLPYDVNLQQNELQNFIGSKTNAIKSVKNVVYQIQQLNEAESQLQEPAVSKIKGVRRTPRYANRNVIPNIIRQVIAFLFRPSRSNSIVDNLIKKHAIQGTSTKRFYTYTLLMKEKMNKYVNADALIILSQIQQPNFEIYSEEQQQFYIKICRILVNYYFKKQFDTINLTSRRMKSDKRLEHLKMKRLLYEDFRQFLNN